MGRGRAKAKQVKVARQLKYSGGGTDLDRLRAELGVDAASEHANGDSAYADVGDRYGADDDSALDDEGEDEEWDSDEDFGQHGAEHGADDLVRPSGSSAGS